MKSSPWVSALIAAALAILSTSVAADDAELPASLEDLMQKEVTSVSKKPQKLAHVAAAVQVIHAEDILQSGANTLAGVLRLVPGVDATPFSGNRWSVSVRGFAELFADKLLVLVDGRNAFNTAFSGVSWQDLQFPLDDIERIEVIRGPAAAIWGSNGMNGVINIITKSAASTQGGQLVLSAGALQGSDGKVRWGGKNTDGSVFYRLYGSAQSAPAGLAPAGIGGSGQDTSGHEAAGLRIDGYVGGGLRWDISADLVQNRADTLAYQYKARDRKSVV
jgi:iron complex outermembrane receptor protein